MVTIDIMESMSTQLVSVTSYLKLRLPQDLLNQFNNTIIIGPLVILLPTTLDLFINSMGCFESFHLFPTFNNSLHSP
jgi:hypothetical protein